jgi:chromosome segregation ATPase
VTDKHDEKQEAIEFLIEENDKLKAQLAVATADDPEFTKNLIDELQAELKQTKIELNAVIKSRDMYQAECAQLKKQVASHQRQARKAA